MKKILFALLTVFILQSSIDASIENLKIIQTAEEFETLPIQYESILCLETEFFAKYCLKSIYIYGSPLKSGKIGDLTKILQNRCSIIFVLRSNAYQLTLTDANIQYLQEVYPNIHTIVFIDEKNKDLIEVLKKKSIVESSLRITYIANNFSLSNIPNQKELNKIYTKRPQDKKYKVQDYEPLTVSHPA